jgi:hypothetical protein
LPPQATAQSAPLWQVQSVSAQVPTQLAPAPLQSSAHGGWLHEKLQLAPSHTQPWLEQSPVHCVIAPTHETAQGGALHVKVHAAPD